MASIFSGSSLATEGNKVSSSFQGKAAIVKCWNTVTEESGLQDKELAGAAGCSKGQYSKVASGQQGDLLGLICSVAEKYPELKREFIARIAEQELIDPLALAAEQIAKASLRFLRLRGEGPRRMAKAHHTAERKKQFA